MRILLIGLGLLSVLSWGSFVPSDYKTTVIESGGSYEILVENDEKTGFRIVRKNDEFGSSEESIAEELYADDVSDEYVSLKQYGKLDFMKQINSDGSVEFVIGLRRVKPDDGYSKILFFKNRKNAEKNFSALKKDEETSFTGLEYSEIYESRRMELHFRLLRFLEDQRKKGVTLLPLSVNEIDSQLKKYGDTNKFVLQSFNYSAKKKVSKRYSIPKKKVKKKKIKKKKKAVKKEVRLRIIN